jgi:flagellin
MFSLSIYKSYKGELAENSKASGRIGNGSRINNAKDSPERIGTNETLKIQVMTNNAASQNVQDANSMLQAFDGSLQEVNNSLNRMKELTIAAGSGDLSANDKAIIQNEVESLKADINDLVSNTNFNGIKLTDSNVINSNVTGLNSSSIKTTIGNKNGENIDIPVFDMSLQNLGIDTLDITDVNKSSDAVDAATKMVSKIRSKYGAIQNGLDETGDYLSSKDITIQKVQSNVGDADIAEEMMKYSKSQILIQSGIALMAQSNNFPKDALNVLANVK